MEDLIKGMLRPEIYDHPVTEFQVIETHISWVILTGPFAYKLKKPVNLGFVDFTSLRQRRYFCEEELRLNRRLAPELYLGVRPIFGTRARPTLHGAGEPIEFAVQMRQFDQRQLLPSVLARDELPAHCIDRFAREMAAFHRRAAAATSSDQFGTSRCIRNAALENLQSLGQTEHNQDLVEVRHWTETEFRSLESWFEQRHRNGFVRECHGDMHLGNMVLLDHQIRLFDCLEFNAQLRWTDVMAEVAFLVMDLQHRGRSDLGLCFLNIWLEQTGDYRGLLGWRWYLIYRALVRAKVAAVRMQQADIAPAEQTEKQAELQHYLALAASMTKPQPRTVILMHGVSGSGKSHVSQLISQRFPAIRVRSDIERKRLFGMWGTPGPVSLTGDMYAASATEFVYKDVLAESIPPILRAGFAAIIDAAALQSWQREQIRDVARKEQAQFVILDVQAPIKVLRDRLDRRKSDAKDISDADIAVLESQLASHEPLTPQELTETVAVHTDSSEWWSSLEVTLRAILGQSLIP